MAREWHPSHDLLPRSDTETTALDDGSSGPSRNWAAARGSVLWEGQVDLTGSFPGFASWGSHAHGVHLTLTDRFLLVDEGAEYGFGLPIGWLSAAHALTGAEAIALDANDRLRICYVDGHQVRGFNIRIRGGRFGARASRRANQFRTAALSLGLASTTLSTELLLPPEHDLALDWDAFASYEAEPVVWTGWATMPIGSGLDLAPSDVWLTDASLIWGARSRAGIYRVATSSLVGITSAQTPAHEPVIFWSVGGLHKTLVDLPMILPRQNAGPNGAAPLDSLLGTLERQGHAIRAAVPAPQPWRAAISVPAVGPQIVAIGAAPPDVPVPVTASQDEVDEMGHLQGSERPDPARPVASRRRLLDDELFPERLPTSIPRPWGDQVERVSSNTTGEANQPGSSRPSPVANISNAKTSDSDADSPGDGSIADRLRIWPPAVPRRQTPNTADAAAMLVRRPPVKATTTEEFLASELAARAAVERAVESTALEPADSGPASVSTPPVPVNRGILVRFRQPEGAIGGPWEDVRQAAGTPATRSTSPSADPIVVPDGPGSESSHPVAPGTRGEPDESAVTRSTTVPQSVDRDVMTNTDTGVDRPQAVSSTEAIRATMKDETAESAESAERAEKHELPDSGLAAMRAAVTRLDEQLALVLREIGRSDRAASGTGESTAPRLRRALAGLDLAVATGEIGSCAADTHRQAITRTADTVERLRSLLDLSRRGYLTAAELEGRRVALLGRPATVS